MSSTATTGAIDDVVGPDEARLAARYLDTMARVLTRLDFPESAAMWHPPADSKASQLWNELQDAAKPQLMLVRKETSWSHRRIDGRDWPAFAETMIGMERLDNVRACIETALADDVPGDLIETGVWRGGATILMRAVLAAYGVTDRTVWVADSFRGLPRPDHERYPQESADDPHWTFDELRVSRDEVAAAFARYGLLDDQVSFLEGWFHETLPDAPIEQIAVLRLDGDMYSSTMDALQALYDRVPDGGFVIVDDFGAVDACRKAIHDFREERGVEAPIHEVDWTGVYWRVGS